MYDIRCSLYGILYFPPMPFALYPETHYRFKYGFSLLFRREPEMLFDCPRWLDPGRDLPLLLFIKDADRFPVTLGKLQVCVQSGAQRKMYDFDLAGGSVSQPFYGRIFPLPVSEFPRGATVHINTVLSYTCRGRQQVLFNDNFPGLDHQGYAVYLAHDPLPDLDGGVYGDCHTHSHYSNDAVEFGLPPEYSAVLAQSLGLRWLAVTDHSYDLDPASRTAVSAAPWVTQGKEIDYLNNNLADFCLIRGEEVSCGNGEGRNVHLLALGLGSMVPGTGDQGQRWFKNKPELTLSQAAAEIRRQGGICFGAHSGVGLGWLERFALNRGGWSAADLGSGIDGMQFWNGGSIPPPFSLLRPFLPAPSITPARTPPLLLPPDFFKGRRQWVSALLQGHRLKTCAGTDSHGDFNRSRKVKIPFLSLSQDCTHLCGQVRTLAWPESLTPEAVIKTLAAGNSACTNGPALRFSLDHTAGSTAMGSSVKLSGPDEAHLKIQAVSNRDFGPLTHIRVYHGQNGAAKEQCLLDQPGHGYFRYSGELPLLPETVSAPGYLRVEAQSANSEQAFLALTNPIWIH
jgi:hypothetical protein